MAVCYFLSIGLDLAEILRMIKTKRAVAAASSIAEYNVIETFTELLLNKSRSSTFLEN